MKIVKMVGTVLIALTMFVPGLIAADYTGISTEKLAEMRQSMQYASEDERRAFNEEWQKRIRYMRPEEREKYLGIPEYEQERRREKNREKERLY
jgi:hypothetical protein